MNDDLRRFVRESLDKGVAREAIADALRKAGWTKEEVATALDAYVDAGLPVPVPRRRPALSAKEAFQYLTMFLCLYLTAFGCGMLLFSIIDRLLPDPSNPYDLWSASDVHLAISLVAVAGPVFLLMTAANARALSADPARRDSPVRKWLTYLTLFVAGGIAIVDLVTLLYNFLEGDMPARFLCKVLAVLAISSAVFGAYLRDLRKDERVR